MNYWTLKEIAFEVKRSPKTVWRWMRSLGIKGGGCSCGQLLYSENDRRRFQEAVESRTIVLLKRAVPVRLKNGVSASGRGEAGRREGAKSVRSREAKTGLKPRRKVG